MFISPAFAQATGAGPDPLINMLVPLLMVLPIFYFLLWRPQQQRLKEHRALIDAIKRGDTVVTSGGIVGTVIKVKDDGEVEVEIAKDVRVRVLKSSISTVRNKGEPIKAA
ncbi:MAG: preprotein translocase subunit YajC [Hyphomicrobiaceae bacterium]